ncbi:hypothetical protein ACQPZX_11615 [Actinoplanes sp. CA-142083]|uniref:hypothetical protein n=1 Tax=Actinoplanes sp. CA-142083 TaxID=3239903 RepID=UPI003D8BA01E
MRTRRAPLRWTFVNQDPTPTADLLHEYVDGRRRHDIPAVITTLSEDCVVIESDGTAHQGHDEIERWLRRDRTDDWVIITAAATADLLIAEWRRGDQEGVTVARPREGVIGYLREYVTTG